MFVLILQRTKVLIWKLNRLVDYSFRPTSFSAQKTQGRQTSPHNCSSPSRIDRISESVYVPQKYFISDSMTLIPKCLTGSGNAFRCEARAIASLQLLGSSLT